MHALIFISALSHTLDLAIAADATPPKIHLEKVRELTLQAPLQEGRKAWVSAASGLVKKGNTFYVVADDENAIFSFGADKQPLKVHPLSDEKLPAVNNLRKKLKPDFEALAELTPSQWPPHGALLAWPSGSTPQRNQAVALPFAKDSDFGKPVPLNVKNVFKKLKKQAKNINVEGLIVKNDKLLMYQRGNSISGKSGLFELPLKEGLGKPDAKKVKAAKAGFTEIKLGHLQAVSLTLAEGLETPHGHIAIATAEDTDSTYDDGNILGTVLLRITEGGEAKIIGRFSSAVKLEGMVLGESTKDTLAIYFVDDTDDPNKASSLYRAKIPLALLK